MDETTRGNPTPYSRMMPEHFMIPVTFFPPTDALLAHLDPEGFRAAPLTLCSDPSHSGLRKRQRGVSDGAGEIGEAGEASPSQPALDDGFNPYDPQHSRRMPQLTIKDTQASGVPTRGGSALGSSIPETQPPPWIELVADSVSKKILGHVQQLHAGMDGVRTRLRTLEERWVRLEASRLAEASNVTKAHPANGVTIDAVEKCIQNSCLEVRALQRALNEDMGSVRSELASILRHVTNMAATPTSNPTPRAAPEGSSGTASSSGFGGFSFGSSGVAVTTTTSSSTPNTVPSGSASSDPTATTFVTGGSSAAVSASTGAPTPFTFGAPTSTNTTTPSGGFLPSSTPSSSGANSGTLPFTFGSPATTTNPPAIKTETGATSAANAAVFSFGTNSSTPTTATATDTSQKSGFSFGAAALPAAPAGGTTHMPSFASTSTGGFTFGTAQPPSVAGANPTGAVSFLSTMTPSQAGSTVTFSGASKGFSLGKKSSAPNRSGGIRRR